MKVGQKYSSALSTSSLRVIENDLGVYLRAPVDAERSPNQQFGVYNKEEKHLGDIIAHSLYFTEAELREKISRLPGIKAVGGLSAKQLRAIENDLGVYLRAPVDAERSPNQQFGVYDEDEKHAGDIIAHDLYFTEVELREKILKLFS